MNTRDNGSSQTQPNLLVARLLVVALVFSVIGYVSIQSMLFDKKNQQVVIVELQKFKLELCEHGIRLPMVSCSKAVLIKGNLNESKEALNQQFARLPNLSSAVGKLQWTNGSEADAVKLLTVLNNLKLSRNRQSSENYRAIPLINKLLEPIWKKYPDMVAASSCMYCSNSFEALSNLIASNDTHVEQLKSLAVGHPRMLREVASQNLFEPKELDKIVRLQAALSSAGDSRTAKYIGKNLLQSQDYKNLRIWLSKGLNGSRALGDTDLNSLPYDLVISAWQKGVSIGYDQVGLSQYLVSSGY
ncbi:MAG: hypothetical protein GY829_06960, partial [Gammaproteobacteria bacterium]|nr:hypothetical protein [Gammaproteobacteria bacterium]